MNRAFALFVPALLLTGCANMSGLDGKKEFTCQAPDGVSCMSVSGVSANVDKGNLPISIIERQKKEEMGDAKGEGVDKPSKSDQTGNKSSITERFLTDRSSIVSPAEMLTPSAGTPIRIPPKELRVWLAPNEDADGDLHDQRYVYLVVNDGRWVLDSARPSNRGKFTQMIPVGSSISTTSGTGEAKATDGKSPASSRPVSQNKPKGEKQPPFSSVATKE
jgi:conjugal transfer pilus assembly protein TraV